MGSFMGWRLIRLIQVRGEEEVTLTPGQTFYEGPSEVFTSLGGTRAEPDRINSSSSSRKTKALRS